MTAISIVIPTLNDGERIEAALQRLGSMRARGAEVIVVDGGSEDDTVARATPLCDRILSLDDSHAARMNAGANVAQGYLLLFADPGTWLPEDADRHILENPNRVYSVWGHFGAEIDGAHPLLPWLSRLLNLHSRASGFVTFDQAIFMTREAFKRVGGFPDLPCMEDIAITKELRKLSRPLCLPATALVTDNELAQNFFWRQAGRELRLRLAWHLGFGPEKLARFCPPQTANPLLLHRL